MKDKYAELDKCLTKIWRERGVIPHLRHLKIVEAENLFYQKDNTITVNDMEVRLQTLQSKKDKRTSIILPFLLSVGIAFITAFISVITNIDVYFGSLAITLGFRDLLDKEQYEKALKLSNTEVYEIVCLILLIAVLLFIVFGALFCTVNQRLQNKEFIYEYEMKILKTKLEQEYIDYKEKLPELITMNIAYQKKIHKSNYRIFSCGLIIIGVIFAFLVNYIV